MNVHHRARRLALQGLCCLDAQGLAARPLLQEFIEDSGEPAEVIAEAGNMLDGAFADRNQCDDLLTRHARHWDLGRLALVDRNILRLAAHELRQARTPTKVVITEAIRLAREFSTAESPRFINGVLDSIARELRGQGEEGKKKPSRDAGDADGTTDRKKGNDKRG